MDVSSEIHETILLHFLLLSVVIITVPATGNNVFINLSYYLKLHRNICIWERWGAKRKLVSVSNHPGASARSGGIVPEKN